MRSSAQVRPAKSSSSHRIFEQANSADYHPFKLATTRRGIASQALQSRLIAKTSVQVAVK